MLPLRSVHRAVALTALVATAATCLVACGADPGAGVGVTADAIVIGTHAPLTGRGSAEGGRIPAGMTAYFEYLDAEGGIDGRSIRLEVADDTGDPAVAQESVRRLVEDEGVFAIVGAVGTETHDAVATYLNARGVPDVFVATGSPAWNDPADLPMTFGFAPEARVEASVLADSLTTDSPDAVACAVVGEGEFGSEFAVGLTTVLRSELARIEKLVDTDASDAQGVASRLASSGCQTVYVATASAPFATLVAISAGLGFVPRWAAASSAGDLGGLLAERGAPAEAALFEGLHSTGYLPFRTGSDWVALFQRIWDERGDGTRMGTQEMTGMAIAYTFTEAIAKTGATPTRATLLKTLEGGRVLGAGIFPLMISESNHTAYNGAQLSIVIGGIQSFVGLPYLAGPGGDAIAYIGDPVPVPHESGIPTG